MKKMFTCKWLMTLYAFALCLFMMTDIPICVEAATTQKAMFLFKNTLYVTCNVSSHASSSSYPYRKPMDIIDNVSGNGNAYAPFDCKVVAKSPSNGNTIAIESLEKVEFADGTIDYMTIMVAHDDDISNISIGKTYKQGDVFYQEGNAGTSSGSHIHLETARGAYSKRSNSSQSIWAFVRAKSNVVYPHNALFLYENTKISKSGGYTWKYATTEEIYTITYDANGGYDAPSPQKYSGDWVTISSTIPYRTGYNFNGWLTTATPGTVNLRYSPGSLQPNMGNETLYAYWKANTYTINYKSNGGSGTMEPSSYKYDEEKALPSNSFTRTGYTFLGWSTKADATAAAFSNGASIKNLTSKNGDTVTLYAVWKINTYTVSYNANGGSGAPSSQTKTHGKDLTLSTTKPTRSGYTFLGWGTSSTATAAAYSAGSTYATNNNVTLYAVWQKNAAPTYTITYDANGGSNPPASQTKTHGKNLTLSTTKPIRSGYTFLGWSTSSTATAAAYSAGSTYVTNNNVTLYAVWQKNAAPTYTITYDANGGSNPPASQTKTHGKNLTLSTTKPIRSGYTFLGWSTSSTATAAAYSAGSTYVTNNNVTLYAVWQKNNSEATTDKSTIKFDETTISFAEIITDADKTIIAKDETINSFAPITTLEEPDSDYMVVQQTEQLTTVTEEGFTEYEINSIEEAATTLMYNLTSEITTEAEKEESSVNIKKIVVIAVVAVIVGAVMFILGKKSQRHI